MDKVILVIMGIVIGFVISKIVKFFSLGKYHKEVADALISCLETENEYVKELGSDSIISYTIEKKGIDYAIYYYGQIYHLLSGAQIKDEHQKEVVNALYLFLSKAMSKEIEEYKKEREKNKK